MAGEFTESKKPASVPKIDRLSQHEICLSLGSCHPLKKQIYCRISTVATTRTPNLGLVFPPLDAVVDEARHIRNLLYSVLEKGAVRVVRLGVLQYPFQEEFVPVRIEHVVRSTHENVA